MPVPATGTLRVFVLSVGQGDCSVVVTPEGHVVVIDAMRPGKLESLLRNLGCARGDDISLLLITHPHDDHYGAANRLLEHWNVRSVALSPFWTEVAEGTPTYWRIADRIDQANIPVQFVSGTTRFYPDGALSPAGANPYWDDASPFLELVGPTNALIGQLERSGDIDTNHLSIMARLTWRSFRMVFAADAQMENWAEFDREGMLEGPCRVLKAAHHGSRNGTQWERLDRLDPRMVIVSSDPESEHHLPDLIGTSIFAEFHRQHAGDPDDRRIVAITSETGSIRVTVDAAGTAVYEAFGDVPERVIRLDDAAPLAWDGAHPDWPDLLHHRVEEGYPADG